NSNICTGCGICEEYCQVKAIKVEGNIAFVERRRCIGCGNCVAKCSSEAIILKKKEEQYIPPQTMDDLFALILEEKNKLTKLR
ncbi:MAG: 4Fe-4S binding protein, partial [Candidatus Thorarchaeota archaeon]